MSLGGQPRECCYHTQWEGQPGEALIAIAGIMCVVRAPSIRDTFGPTRPSRPPSPHFYQQEPLTFIDRARPAQTPTPHLAQISQNLTQVKQNQPKSPKSTMLKFGDVSFDLGFERGRMSATGYVAKISMLRLNIGSGKLSSCMLRIGRGPKAVQGKGGAASPCLVRIWVRGQC